MNFGKDASAGAFSDPGTYRDGEYEGTGEGYRGKVHVWVQIDQGNISDLEIMYHDDDDLVGGSAMEELLGMVLDYNSADLDAVSGATESCAGFIDAVNDALKKAAR
jgi:fumarate reductase flavoprotein subunit